MKSATGRWVSGDDFFGRESELSILKSRLQDRNHVLLAGQRRMGKTSLARELGRQIELDGWNFIFVDVEGAASPEDVVARIAEAAFPTRRLASRFSTSAWSWFKENVEELNASGFGMKFRSELNPGNWQRLGKNLLRDCVAHGQPTLLVIDELPIFLKRLLRESGGTHRVDMFLSWIRGEIQMLGKDAPILIVSGSIGLAPLVARLGIPDRINYLDPIRLGPWDRETSKACIKRLASSHNVSIDDGVAEAVYEALGIGIPQHVQSFFARLREFAIKQDSERLSVEDVAEVYRTELLGPSGQSDLVHYETRLSEALDGQSYAIAMEILAEAATQDYFTPNALVRLEILYLRLVEDAADRISEVIDVLTHDGYLLKVDYGGLPHYRFPSLLLKDWWSARNRDHYKSLKSRVPAAGGTLT